MKVHPILTPVVTIGDQLEALAFQRMMGMDYLETRIRTVTMRRS